METLEEINKTIAEYMGMFIIEDYEYEGIFHLCKAKDYCEETMESLYTCSLDALVPVWRKIGGDDDDSVWLTCFASGVMKNAKNYIPHGCSIQEAAARATYKVIKEL